MTTSIAPRRVVDALAVHVQQTLAALALDRSRIEVGGVAGAALDKCCHWGVVRGHDDQVALTFPLGDRARAAQVVSLLSRIVKTAQPALMKSTESFYHGLYRRLGCMRKTHMLLSAFFSTVAFYEQLDPTSEGEILLVNGPSSATCCIATKGSCAVQVSTDGGESYPPVILRHSSSSCCLFQSRCAKLRVTTLGETVQLVVLYVGEALARLDNHIADDLRRFMDAIIAAREEDRQFQSRNPGAGAGAGAGPGPVDAPPFWLEPQASAMPRLPAIVAAWRAYASQAQRTRREQRNAFLAACRYGRALLSLANLVWDEWACYALVRVSSRRAAVSAVNRALPAPPEVVAALERWSSRRAFLAALVAARRVAQRHGLWC